MRQMFLKKTNFKKFARKYISTQPVLFYGHVSRYHDGVSTDFQTAPPIVLIVRSKMAESNFEQKVEIIGADDTNLTFVLRDEDHTLGNALRYILMRHPDVKFCGYSIPHPSENVMNIRVETFGKSASQLFRGAILDLKAMADHMRTSFGMQLENFMSMQAS